MFIYAETVQHPTISGEKLAKKSLNFLAYPLVGGQLTYIEIRVS